ncbi:hypothetical protein [Desulfovibrio sp. ZJ200]|uniref:hypothetical protein n=1 Tax=Desulfovibrio sp. ZJ200 TaxID=2709792 RepID=UPI00197FAFB3|nr:hypothetical protein [Desulfovibrio sp. ZJ200]
MSRNPASALRLFQARRHVPGGHGRAEQDCLQVLSGKLVMESKFFWQKLDGRAAFGYKNPRPNVFLFKKGIPWTAGKDRSSLSCCAPKRFGCLWLHTPLTGFDIRRRCQMPENVEPFQPEDGPHRATARPASDPGL